jgi:hypothetical protein
MLGPTDVQASWSMRDGAWWALNTTQPIVRLSGSLRADTFGYQGLPQDVLTSSGPNLAIIGQSTPELERQLPADIAILRQPFAADEVRAAVSPCWATAQGQPSSRTNPEFFSEQSGT